MVKVEDIKLKTISLDELEKVGIVTFDVLHFLNQSKKEIILLKAGEYVLPKFIDKYRAKGIHSFLIKPVFEIHENENWRKLWESFLSTQNKDEYDVFQQRKLFINAVKEVFFDAKTDNSLLSYMSVTHNQFVGLSNDFIHQYAQDNYLLLKRSILVASIALPLVISLGYADVNFLKDLYNTTLLLSCHLLDGKFTVTVKNALTLEAMEHGLGFKYLVLKSPNELSKLSDFNKVENMSQVAYEFQNIQIKDLIYFYQSSMSKDLSETLSIENDLPDWVSAVLLIDKLIPYEEINFNPNDASGYLKKIIDKKFDERFIKSYGFKKLRCVFENFWQVSFLPKDKVA